MTIQASNSLQGAVVSFSEADQSHDPIQGLPFQSDLFFKGPTPTENFYAVVEGETPGTEGTKLSNAEQKTIKAARKLEKKALKDQETIVANDPSQDEPILKLLNLYYKTNNRERAVAYFREQAKLHPDVSMFSSCLLSVQIYFGDIDGALTTVEWIKETGRKDFEGTDKEYVEDFLPGLSMSLVEMPGGSDQLLKDVKPKELLDFTSRLVQKYPESATALACLAFLYAMQGDISAGEEKIAQAAQMDPNNESVQGIKKLIGVFTGNIAPQQGDPSTWTQEEFLYELFRLFRSQEMSRILEVTELWLAKNNEPEQQEQRASVYVWRAMAYAVNGETNQAVEESLRSVRLDPKNTNAWVNLGKFYSLQGQNDQAVESLERAVVILGETEDSFKSTGVSVVGDGKISTYHETDDNKASLHDVLLVLSEVYENKKDIPKAIERLEWACQLEPQNQDSRLSLINLCTRQNEFEKAVNFATNAVKDFPNQSNFTIRLGFAELKRGNIQQGSVALEAALRQDPKFLDYVSQDPEKLSKEDTTYEYHIAVGQALIRMGKYDVAGNNFAIANYRDVKRPEAYLGAGHIQIEAGNFGEAETVYKKAADEAGFTVFNDYFHLGDVDVDSPEYLDKEKQLIAALQIDPNDAMLWIFLGSRWEGLQNQQKTSHCYDRAIAANPDLFETRFIKAKSLSVKDDLKERIANFGRAFQLLKETPDVPDKFFSNRIVEIYSTTLTGAKEMYQEKDADMVATFATAYVFWIGKDQERARDTLKAAYAKIPVESGGMTAESKKLVKELLKLMPADMKEDAAAALIVRDIEFKCKSAAKK